MDEQKTEEESEPVQEVTEEEDQLSQQFKEFNNDYYTHYKNYLDLIGSNFELIGEGMYSQNLIDDIITWTNDFNELLDVYSEKAKPVNEMDEELYGITTEMIENQRKVNEYIISGLENDDGMSLMNAGSYLETVVDLYLQGHRQLQ